MNRNTALLLCALTGSSISTYAQVGGDKEHPNIILFVSDDHGLDALGCYGNKNIKTPNLDALAASGVRFENAYCTSSSSAASRSVLLTGLYGHATGSYGHTHDYHHFSTYEDVASLPMILSEGGYYTARVGKYHLAPESVYHFDDVFKASERNPVEMADQCVDVFKSEKPFFLYFCTGDPHRANSLDPDDWSAANSFGNEVGGYSGVKEVEYSPDEVIVPDFLPDNEVTRKELAQYYKSVTRVDTGLGYLMDMLERSGKSDNTIVIYISDNGMAFPMAKTTLYEPGMHLPCIVKGVGVKGRNRVDKSLISWVDWTPTIIDLAGVEYDMSKLHGISQAGVLQGSEKSLRDCVYASHTFHEITMYYPMRVIRGERYKLIWNAAYKLDYPFASDLWSSSTWQNIYRSGSDSFGCHSVEAFLHRDEFELYDLKSDPNELHNLAYEVKYQSVLDEMVQCLKAWQLETRDPWYILWSGDASMQGSGVGL